MSGALRSWDPPGRIEQSSGLVAAPAGTQAQGLIEAIGRWTAVDCVVQLPALWVTNAVKLRLVASWESIQAVLDERRADQLDGARTSGGGATGILFSARGRPCSAFSVEADPIGIDLPEAWLQLRCWGEDGVYGDQPQRLAVDLFGRPSQARSANALMVAAGAPVVLVAAAPGIRPAMARLVVTSTDVTPGRVDLLETTPFGNFVRASYFVSRGGPVVDPMLVPLPAAHGSGWSVVISTTDLTAGAFALASATVVEVI